MQMHKFWGKRCVYRVVVCVDYDEDIAAAMDAWDDYLSNIRCVVLVV